MDFDYIIKHLELLPSACGVSAKLFKEILPKFSSAMRQLEHDTAFTSPVNNNQELVERVLSPVML